MKTRGGLVTAAAAIAVFSGSAALAAELPAGIGPIDRRTVVELHHSPWNAIAKIQTNIATRCTGVLVGPGLVLTAAHCLYNRKTRTLLHSQSLHVLFGYNRGDYLWHTHVVRYTLGKGFDGAEPAAHPGSDWAELRLAAPLPPTIEPLEVASTDPAPGSAVALPGYNQDRSQVLMADLSCYVTGIAVIRGERLLAHDCAATRGTSGGPLLGRNGGRWEVVGVNIAVGTSANLALPASAFRLALSAGP